MNLSIEDKDDKLVLDYFFTNSDKPIFVAKNMHPEVWALLCARYSRSKEGMREGFLKLLKEDKENYGRILNEIKRAPKGVVLEHASKKAIQFMDKWVLAFGHSSVAEGAVVGIGIEGVSIISSKAIEDNRLSSFIEKSTRYVSFDANSFYLDPRLMGSKYSKDILDLNNLLFSTYMELHEPVLDYIRQSNPVKDGQSKSAWERATSARRFDAIRYLLPASTKTSLGWTVNARELENSISKMLSHPLYEVQKIADEIKEEATKVLPSLLKYASKKDYFVNRDSSFKNLEDIIDDICEQNPPDLYLAEGPLNKDAEDIVLSSILYKYGKLPYTEIKKKVNSMSLGEREEIIDKYMKGMKEHDKPGRELERIIFTFDILMDYGAYRDLQRHRFTTQTAQILSTDLGYRIPNDIVDSGNAKKYSYAMNKAKEVYDKIKREFTFESQYVVPLGYNIRFLLTMNLREAYTLIKTRTSSSSHESYRNVALKCYKIFKDEYPLLTKYMQLGSEKFEGRITSEEKVELK